MLAAIPALLFCSARLRAAPTDAVQALLLAYEAASGGRAGLYCRDVTRGVELHYRSQERFALCSTFKASLAGLVLHRRDRGELTLGEHLPFGARDLGDLYAPTARQHLARGAISVREACAGAVEWSDNVCANLLLQRVGGPTALTAYWRELGDATSRLDHDEPALNHNVPGAPDDTTSPAAMGRTLERLLLGHVLTERSTAQLRRWMMDCRTGSRRLRAGLPSHWVIANKTGNNGADASGDIAVVWPTAQRPLVLCLYLQGGEPSVADIDRTFASVGAAVREGRLQD